VTENKTASGLAVVISGPSGIGKSTVCRALAERYGYSVSVSATTRAPRADETDGVEYRFMDRKSFLEEVERGRFLEHSEHFDNLYGTPAAPVKEALAAGKTILLEIDVNGARQVKESVPQAFLIFLIAPTSEEMERRLRERHTDSEASIRTRLQRADMEIGMQIHDVCVINDDLEQAIREVHAKIQEAEGRKSHEC